MTSNRARLGFKIIPAIAAAAAISAFTLAGSGAALAHGMGHMGGNMGPNMGTNTKAITTVTKTGDHHRDRRWFRNRFLAFDYITPYPYCFYKRTFHGIVKICPDLY